MDLKKIQSRREATIDDPSGYKRMLAGLPVEMPDGYVFALQDKGAAMLAAFNALPATDFEARSAFLKKNIGRAGQSMIKSPVYWEYGIHLELGEGVFVNVDCKFLDGNKITIGDNTAIAPGVMFLSAGHPVAAADRYDFDPDSKLLTGMWMLNKPITVGKQCWIGAGAMILGGVSIGDRTMIGAGSVVTKSLPSDVLAVGNPARIVRKIEPGDGMPDAEA